MRRIRPVILLIALLAHLPASSSTAYGITRDTVMATAEQYATVVWYCSASNANSAWNDYTADTWNTGVCYNWGGIDSVAQFQAKIAQGAIAGTTHQETHTEFAGLDCSGFVLRCWGYTRHTYSTASLYKISDEIAWEDLQRGDVMNLAGSHVRLFEKYDASDPNKVWVYESTGGVTPARVVHRTVAKSGMVSAGYIPRRYDSIEEGVSSPPIISPGSSSSPGPVLADVTPTFTWTAVTGATGYGLYIQNATTGGFVFPNINGITTTPLTGTSFELPAGFLASLTQYRWYMTSFVGTIESGTVSSTLYFRTPVPLIPGDLNHDGFVTDADVVIFSDCTTGAEQGPPGEGCAVANLDGDHDVDQSDFGILQRCFSGVGVIGDPHCND